MAPSTRTLQDHVDLTLPTSGHHAGSATQTPKHSVALRIMLKYNWSAGKALGKREQGIIVPVKARIYDTGRMSRDEVDERPAEELEKEACVSLMRQACDAWDLVEVCERKDKRSYGGFNTIFEDEGYDEVERGSTLPQLPEARANINGLEVNCLIDTGSQVTCVAREFWECHLKDQSCYPIMPVAAVQIKGAMGQKSQRVSRLVLVPLQFGDVLMNTPCLIIPKLIRSIILGVNWLDDYDAEVKCGANRELIVKVGGIRRSIELRESGVTLKKSGDGNAISSTNITANISTESYNVAELKRRIRAFVEGLDLEREGKRKLAAVLDRHHRVFVDRPGLTNMYTHEIQMVDETPFVKRSYPVPFAYRVKIDEKIHELETLGIISREATQFSSPLTYTLKKDGTVRILLDARELNTRMKSEVETPPLTSEILQRFHGVKHITTLDLNNAYFQIPLSEESRKYTGFVYNGKSFVYKVLPQGLKTSVGSFSRAMDRILGPGMREFCANYLDDLVIYTSGDLNEHIDHIDIVLGRLEAANMTCKLEKCQFVFTEVRMLGHIITPYGIQMDAEKIKAIKSFPAPKKVKQVRAFLGLCNYYRRFARKYGATTRVLCDLLQKNKAWRWTDIEQNAFDEIKSLFIDSVMLHHHDPKSTYYLQTDSSGFAIGAELYQLDQNGDHHVIGFVSKGLTGPELRWTVSEQELYAIIYALQKFETYLRGVKLVIRTDHQALSFLRAWKMYSGRVTRWILYLNQFDYTIEYVKGKDNIGPDILSRYSSDAENVQEEKVACPEVAAFAVEGKQQIRAHLKKIDQLQRQDELLGEIHGYLGLKLYGPPTKAANKYLGRCKLESGVIYYTAWKDRVLLAIPHSMTEEVGKFVHLETGHAGMFKTISAVRDRYFWPLMTKQLKQLVRGCHLCQLAKREIRPAVGSCRSIITQQVGEVVMADLYGPLPRSVGGAKFIFVIQDTFSRFVRLYNLKVANTKSVLKCVVDFDKKVKIESLLTDNGTQFTSKQWDQGLGELGIKILHTSVRNPGPNITERVNKELGRIFRIYCHQRHTKWALHTNDIEKAYNNSIHCSTGFSPNEVAFGEPPKYDLDKYLKTGAAPVLAIEDIRSAVRENLINNAKKRQHYYNLNKRLVVYELGTMVKLKKVTQSSTLTGQIKKFGLLYEGPYVIAAAPYSNTYTLTDPKTGEIKGDYSAIHLARYYMDRTKGPQEERDTELVFRDRFGGLAVMNADNLTTRQLMTNSTFRQLNAVDFKVSSNLKYVLLISDVRKGFQFTSFARYYVYEIATRTRFPLSPLEDDREAPLLQHAEWSPDGNAVVFVHDNDIYYKPRVLKPLVCRITSSGKPGVIFNGVPDHLYETEISRSGHALWFSSDGQYLMFATYNDTRVGEHRWAWYGGANQQDQLKYPEIRSVRYPKANTDNPEVTIYTVNLKTPKYLFPHAIQPSASVEPDSYVMYTAWVSERQVAVLFLNRMQNYSIISVCKTPQFNCQDVYSERAQSGMWSTLGGEPSGRPGPPFLFSRSGQGLLTLATVRDGDAGGYCHVVHVGEQGRSAPVTMGPFEVTGLRAWDEDNGFVYFIATPEKKPGQRHLYRIRLQSTKPPDDDAARNYYTQGENQGTNLWSDMATMQCLTCPSESGLSQNFATTVEEPPSTTQIESEEVMSTTSGEIYEDQNTTDSASTLRMTEPTVRVTAMANGPAKSYAHLNVAGKRNGVFYLNESVPNNCLYNNVIFSTNGRYYVQECLGPEAPSVYLAETLTNSRVGILHPGGQLRERVAGLAAPQLRSFQVEVRHGYHAQVRLYLPPGLREYEEIPFPLILQVDASPGSQLVSEKFQVDWAWYLSSTKNFIVAQIDGRGSGFQGDNLRKEIYLRLGTVEVEDQIAVLTYLRDNLKIVDAGKICVWGSGYGGHVAGMMTAEDSVNLTKCSVAVAPIVTWSYHNTFFTERYLGPGTSSGNYRGYEAADLTRKAGNLAGRSVLLATALADVTAPAQHSLALARSLVRQGVMFRHQVYPDEDHEFSGSQLHLYKNIEAFFDDCFGPMDLNDWDLGTSFFTFKQ